MRIYAHYGASQRPPGFGGGSTRATRNRGLVPTVQRMGSSGNGSGLEKLLAQLQKQLDRLIPPKRNFKNGEEAPINRLIKSLPPWLSAQLQEDTIHRTIKYITWGVPTILFPAITYSVTKDKDEAIDNFYRDMARYAPGPVIQLGIDYLMLEVLFARYMPGVFSSRAQAELLAFLTAFPVYGAWVTLGVQRTVEQSRKFTRHQHVHNYNPPQMDDEDDRQAQEKAKRKLAKTHPELFAAKGKAGNSTKSIQRQKKNPFAVPFNSFKNTVPPPWWNPFNPRENGLPPSSIHA